MRYATGLLVVAACSAVFASDSTGRTLTFEDRVKAQAAIEQVYWDHRIWPKDNPGPKPPRSAGISDEAIRARVADYLRKSSALETWWQRPITGDQLQAELDRMARDTRDATVLRELFAALGNDPFVIAETLGRETLADRLIRSWYAYDTRFHSALRERAERALADRDTVAAAKRLGGEYREVTWVRSRGAADGGGTKNDEVIIAPDEWADRVAELRERFGGTVSAGNLPIAGFSLLKETADGFSAVMVLQNTADRVRVGSVSWPKTTFESWWASRAAEIEAGPGTTMAAPGAGYVSPELPDAACTPDTWQTTRIEMPRSREAHSAVWTGSEMIVWGGVNANSIGVVDNGARYNPSTDTWTALSKVGAPTSPVYHSAVWSGTEMIVWGGRDPALGSDVNTGGRYNPSSDTWVATGTAGAPSVRESHTAVWTGTQMIVWGGENDRTSVFMNDGGRYTPTTNTWTATSTAAGVPAAREFHTAIWTGTQMVVWGGQGNASGLLLNSGGRYFPGSNSWVATGTATSVPTARSGHTAVWSGTEMIVWGGSDASGVAQTGGRYNLTSLSWTPTSTGANVPSARSAHSAVWTGSQMVVWGGGGAGGQTNTGGRYAPATDSWIATSTGANVPSARDLHSAVWTGTEMIVWGGYDGTRDIQSGGRYNPSTDSWVATASSFAPEPTWLGTAVWTGAEMIVWGGESGPSSQDVNFGARYKPSTDSWTATSIGSNNPSPRESHTAVWTGTEMIVWGGHTPGTDHGDGGRYNPATDTWAATSTGANVPTARSVHTAVWTGSQMIVWGGAFQNTGGRYDPSGDSWTPTSTGANTPTGRSYHAAVWTGSKMIIWGGTSNGGGPTDVGGRYDPSTDSWTATSVGTNTPAGLLYFTSVWTGKEMIVWSGQNGNHGGRYDPVTDSWTATSTGANVPSGREGHSAVWTGSEMIVWGGGELIGGMPLNDGARYSPWTDTWTATSIGSNVPNPRGQHYAVWTGTEMIVWGGHDAGGDVGTRGGGGRYCVDICGPSVTCTDSNPCTTDACDSAVGCSFVDNTAPCDDGNGCTVNDACSGGVCQPGTPITAPPEAQSIAAASDKATYNWAAAASATQYDVVRGDLAAFPVGPGSGDETCFDNLPGPSLSDATIPSAGTGFWYLSRGENSCGIGTWGSATSGPRSTTTCP